MPRACFFSSGVSLFFSPNPFLGEVLSSQIEGPQKNKWCTSIVACVCSYFRPKLDPEILNAQSLKCCRILYRRRALKASHEHAYIFLKILGQNVCALSGGLILCAFCCPRVNDILTGRTSSASGPNPCSGQPRLEVDACVRPVEFFLLLQSKV